MKVIYVIFIYWLFCVNAFIAADGISTVAVKNSALDEQVDLFVKSEDDFSKSSSFFDIREVGIPNFRQESLLETGAGKMIFAMSVPKCGSFLLYECIKKITGKRAFHLPILNISKFNKDFDGIFMVNHEMPTLRAISQAVDLDLRMVFIYRDPRDQIISAAYFFKKINEKNANELSIDDLIISLIENSCRWWDITFRGSSSLAEGSIERYYRYMLAWGDQKFVYVTRFEDLVGSKGGGSDEVQLQQVKNIAKHINHPLLDNEALEVAQSLYGNTQTFRNGQIGSWKKIFTERHKELFKELAGELLIELGHEEDYSW